MKAFIYSLFMFLFLLLGAGQTSYGFDIDTTLPLGSSEHTAFVERANDKAVAVEQLTLSEPEVSVGAQQQQNQADPLRDSGGFGEQLFNVTLPDGSAYLVRSALITPSCTCLVLIFPFHLFP